MRKLLFSAFVGLSVVSDALGGYYPPRTNAPRIIVYVPVYVPVYVRIPTAKQPAKKKETAKEQLPNEVQKVKDDLRKALENLDKVSKEAKKLLGD